MAILRERTVWRSKRSTSYYARTGKLTPEEQASVIASLCELRARLGTWGAVALAFGVHVKTMKRIKRGAITPGARHAVSAARLLDVGVDDVLGGEFAKTDRRARCG
jgi:hypothetical protein